MKTFLAIFTCAENSKNHQAWKTLDLQTQKDRYEKGMVAKDRWVQKYKSQIVFDGGALGERTKQVNHTGIHEIPSLMGAFLVIQAESHEEAAKMFVEHPHFACFPGDGVEIIERIDYARGS